MTALGSDHNPVLTQKVQQRKFHFKKEITYRALNVDLASNHKIHHSLGIPWVCLLLHSKPLDPRFSEVIGMEEFWHQSFNGRATGM
jgi:hypothetical protein